MDHPYCRCCSGVRFTASVFPHVKREAYWMLVRVVKHQTEQGHTETLSVKRKGFPVSPVMVSLCFHRQGAGSLRHGPQPLRHAGPGLPDDLQEHDSGGCHWASVTAPLHLAKQGLLEAAERTGHRAGTAEEEQQEQPSTCWAAQQHHHLAWSWHSCATGKETP